MYGAIACLRGGKHRGDAAAAATAAAISKTDLLHWVLLATVDTAQLLVVAWHLVVRDVRGLPKTASQRESVTDRSARTLSHKADDRQRVLPLAPRCLKVNVTDLYNFTKTFYS